MNILIAFLTGILTFWGATGFGLGGIKPVISSITFDTPKSISVLIEQQKCKEWNGKFYLRSDSLGISYSDENYGKKAIMKCTKTTRQVVNYALGYGASTTETYLPQVTRRNPEPFKKVETEITETLFDYDLTL